MHQSFHSILWSVMPKEQHYKKRCCVTMVAAAKQPKRYRTPLDFNQVTWPSSELVKKMLYA
ncbi:hypothetical protein HPB52_006272 [Rhipicephalus sanguineus]|uniref:Uncharacterized protein n=1 Tax=Rhipicephalus sanguineus TaxID=34632 RepID=A0A9D4PL92_RHISA|nr:hypothetical protein HPB52_006272 [Rhipicephalus sanguineus]